MKVFGKSKFFIDPLMFSEGSGDAGDSKEGKGQGGSTEGSEGKPPDTSGGSSGSSEGENKPFATFPTEQALMARINQGAESRLKKAAEEAGFESVDAFKEAAKKAREIEEQNKTDLEKAKDREAQLEADLNITREKADRTLINSELKVFAAQMGFVDPDDAVILADKTEIQVDDSDKVTGAKEAIEALAKNKPHLVGKKKEIGGSSVNPGGDGDTTTEEEKGKQIAEARLKGRKQSDENAYNPWAS